MCTCSISTISPSWARAGCKKTLCLLHYPLKIKFIHSFIYSFPVSLRSIVICFFTPPPTPRPLLPFFVLFFVCLFVFCLFVCLFWFWSFVWFVASDFFTTICHLAFVNVCVIIILSIGNTQISILLFCFLHLFVELVITMNE